MVTKLLLFLLIFASLYVLAEIFMFYRAWKREENNITVLRAVLIGISLSYILTIILTGLGN